MKKPEITTAEDFFLGLSNLRKHPDFKKIKQDFIDSEILEIEDEKKVASKGNAYKNTKSGYRKDLGLNLRSNWEANFARILNAYKIQFDFEPTTFAFPVKRGTKGYIPDFYINKSSEWVEIKGYLDDKSKIKLKRFKRYYEDDFNKLTFIISKYSTAAKKFAEEIEIPNVLYYEDIRNAYMEKLSLWEGK
jgi:hypothetical protein